MSLPEETKGIIAVIILEVVGRPPKYLTETLNDLVKKVDEEQGVKVIGKKLNNPELMKDQKGFYTSFVEIEVEIEEILYLTILLFKYMPAHIEIISPELIVLTNNGWNDILNELTRRLHGYDEVARVIQIEKNILEKRLREILENEPIEKSKTKSKGKKK